MRTRSATMTASHRHRGLTSDEARMRLGRDGPNRLPPPERPDLWQRIEQQVREPMAVLLLGAAIISGLFLGEVVDAVAIVAIVVANAVIALVQEGRAERALEKLEELEAPSATVVRDGRQTVVDAAELVVGDLVLVRAGDRVPADAEVVETETLEVDESILTGESLPVGKRRGGLTDDEEPIGDRDGRLHSGTLVLRGTGRAIVIAIGIDTELGSIAAHLRRIRREPTPLQQQLAAVTRRLGVAALVIAGGMFALTLLIGRDTGIEDAFLTAVALAVAAVPEGLAAVTTVALALGVGRMARRGAIVRRLPAVETLGATDVLIIDKTGTLTENRMDVSVVIDAEGTEHERDMLPAGLRDHVETVLILCNDATLEPPAGDPTERGLLALADTDDVELLRDEAPRLATAPFTSERRRMSTLHRLPAGLTLLMKGAPEQVISLCGRRWLPDGDEPLAQDVADRLLALAEQRAGRGERLLALAQRRLDEPPSGLEEAERDLVLLALVALRDPPRPAAHASVEATRAAGMGLIMATGDHPATAGAIADEVGLTTRTLWTGTDLRERGLPHDPAEVDVYARVEPGQKLDLVEQLQADGHTVAMTGDGVNDAPALRRADIGVALGESGSAVAREAADLVITDDDLATIVEAVREGRGIYDNLRKVIDYLVSSNLAEVTVVLATLLMLPAFGVPLYPLQLLWINLLTDGLPALALGVDEPDPRLMLQPPRDTSIRLLDASHLRRLASRALVLATGAMTALLLAHHVLDLTTTEARTVLFTTLVVAQVLYAYVIRRKPGYRGRMPRNRWLLLSVVGALALQLLVVLAPPAQTVFDTASLPLSGWFVTLLAGATAPLAIGLAVALVRND